MEKYELKIFPSAEQDLKDVINYLNEFSPQAALKIYDEIVAGIASLEQMPMRCSLAKNTVLRAKQYRLLLVQNYVVFFIVNGNVVQIRRILYGRRQYEFLL
ncbi:type II toxin-antitoxin system RelE/ParE family toxin [Desulfosporosinus sp. BICA1-9]|uniref:type II toxin-antitoxin system RelE/ParE family toxin n=1 Tax=Desulfosporosinus sp. BICA1-9 TaxID=1531958 RepID=UPI00054C61BB|nr:type II toxin-antitoxin system RelE/ParE family toxin [Desulfosporosinus sp. BICA1-9]KJS46903.1 MAG: RelE/StbE family addiction module toxin [Peptococcaceae bacterium BRH_c23]KJS89971.1 MAG: RelE/StbE family addiction module toxin [Desulfosporosinus sp. BICA1-9]HBW37888.1 type II toxin-antitoxin system RelE/ParE family toxin [Desulfosporosinus sp.]